MALAGSLFELDEPDAEIPDLQFRVPQHAILVMALLDQPEAPQHPRYQSTARSISITEAVM